MQKGPIYEEIPGVPQCHCSMVHKLPDGNLICAWFAGQYEKARDVAIWASWADSNGKNWSKPRIIANTLNRSNGSPVFYQDPKGVLHLFYHTMHHGKIIKGGWSVVNIRHKTSFDNGISWNDWEWFRRGWLWVLRCRPHLLQNDTVILPAHFEAGKMHTFFLINTKPDLSGKWIKSEKVNTPRGCDEPSVCELQDGTLICSLRTHDKKVFFTRSYDHGLTWTKPVPSRFDNPDSQTDIYCTSSNKLVLVLNNLKLGRLELSYTVSEDGGETWSEETIIEKAPEDSKIYAHGYSYPSIIELDNKEILVTYTHLRTRIFWANLGIL